MVTIECDALQVRLGQRSVLKNVTAKLKAGQFVGVVGPNGAGKSTLVRTLLGLIPPEAGTIIVDGKPLHRFS